MTYMFYGCTNLETIYASTWFVTTAITTTANGNNMFSNDVNIIWWNGTTYSASNVTKTYARIDVSGTPWYFTDKTGPIKVSFILDGVVYDTQTVNFGNKVTRPINPSKDWVNFVKWVDADGVEFDFNTKIEKYTEIYARFDSNDAILLNWTKFSETLKRLANNNVTAIYNTADTKIKNIKQWTWNSIPSGVTKTWVVSAPYSDREIVAWFDSSSSTIYYYTEAETIYMNSSSNNMFQSMKALTWIDLNSWNASKVRNMSYMFNAANALTWIDLNSWNVSGVTNMSYMFYNAVGLQSIDISSWNTSSVTNMSYMFYGCTNLETIYASTWFVTTAITTTANGNYMFTNSTKIIWWNWTKYSASNVTKTYARIDKAWQVWYFTDKDAITVRFVSDNVDYDSQVVQYWEMAIAPSTNPTKPWEIFKKWVDKNGAEFDFTTPITKYTEVYASFVLDGVAILLPWTEFKDEISSLAWNADNITKILQWTWNSVPSGVTTGVLSIEDSAYPVYGWYDNGTIYYYTEATIIYMNENSAGMFGYLYNLVFLDVNKWNASNVTDMAGMFELCNGLTWLDLSSWDTSRVTDMSAMFAVSEGLVELNLGGWDTSSVTNMNSMFYYCTNLETIYASTWFVVNNVAQSEQMFSFNTSLVWWNGTTYNSSKTNKEYARIDTAQTPWYFTKIRETTLERSTNLNQILKTLSDNKTYTTTEDKIIQILQWTWNSIPNWVTTGLLSTQDSEYPVYGWFDSGTLYYYTQAQKIYMNADSSSVFWWLVNLKYIDLTNIDTSRVLDMNMMFNECNSLESLDLRKWDTSNVTNMSKMFRNCENLETIYVSDKFSTAWAERSSSQMFTNDVKLVWWNGTTYDSTKTDLEYAVIDNLSQSWYFTKDITLTFDTKWWTPINFQILPVWMHGTRPANPVKSWHTFSWWSTENSLMGTEFDFSQPLYKYTKLYAKWDEDKEIIIEVTATEADQTLTINKYFNSAYTVDWGDGSPVETVSTGITHPYDTAWTYNITLSLTWNATRWKFFTNGNNNSYTLQLVPKKWTTVTWVKIIYMPSLVDWFWESSTKVGGNFFLSFNANWAITSLPEWSFDTSYVKNGYNQFFGFFNKSWSLISLPTWSFNISNIETGTTNFFSHFNNGWAITSLPEWSFDISKLTYADVNFFYNFNNNWAITSLPGWSFNISNITDVPLASFFNGFNANWAITSLPEWSFNTSNITWTVGDTFFAGFNSNWAITILPTWSFNISNITEAGNNFFGTFNYQWKITSLPAWSFNTENVTKVGNSAFYAFNNQWEITSLPAWSFNTEKIIEVWDRFFNAFNQNWKITSLPTWSFNIENIVTVWTHFFGTFNSQWKITILPEWSFKLSTWLTMVKNNFFSNFNNVWELTSLPQWSFDVSNIDGIGTYFFYRFNYNWKITTLPDSFTIKMIPGWSWLDYVYTQAFNSSNYTLNRKVSDLVSWQTAPKTDRNTFSDNQPWRCGVHAYWLQNLTNACSITYDTNGWSVISSPTKKYNANVTWVAVWNGITAPTRVGYTLWGWQNASWENVDAVLFPAMDGETLYARWIPAEYTITYNLNWWTQSATNPTAYTVESWTFWLYQPTKTGYMFLWWTGSNWSTPNANVYITQWSTWNRTYNAVWWNYENIDAYFISSTWEVSYITLMDRNMWASTTWVWESASTWSYGFHYQWWNNNGFQIWCWIYWWDECSDGVTLKSTWINAVWNNGYNNKWYNWTRFIIWSNDYWTGGLHYDGLRWGSGDAVANKWWLSTITLSNIENRQWPCPVWYHVPSIWEWNNLLKYRASAYTWAGNYLILNEDAFFELNYFTDDEVRWIFQQDFSVPSAGLRRNIDWFISLQMIRSLFRSSSPYDVDYPFRARYFNFDPTHIYASYFDNRSDGQSIRCFSNDYLFNQPSITIHPNGWTGAMVIVEGNRIKALWTPHRDNFVFNWWYSDSAMSVPVTIWSTAPANIYAKWVDNIPPTMIFTWDTPADNVWQTRNYYTGQIDIIEANLSGFTADFNGNQTSLYDDSLVLMYNFDNVSALWESSTLVKDLSKYGNDGIVHWATWTNNGVYGWAFNFNGSDGYIQTNSPEVKSVFGTWTHFTVSAWAKAMSWISYSSIISQTNWYSWSNSTFWLWNQSDWFNCVLWTHTWTNDTQKDLKRLAYKPSLWEWHHIVCTIEWNSMKMYVDGILVKTANLSGMNTRSVIDNPIYIWKHQQYKTFTWQIDEVRVYNRALSASEIEELYRWNLSRLSTDKWTYTASYTWLDDWTYVYGWTVTDVAWQSASVSRTINIDTTKPTCTISQVPASWTWTSGSVTITANVIEQYPSAWSWTWWDSLRGGYPESYVVSQNWTENFYTIDYAGNTWSCSITVENIDKEKPVITLSPTSGWTWKSHSVTLTLTENGNAWLPASQTLYYRWQTSSTCSTTQSDYSTLTITNTAWASSTTKSITKSDWNGSYYLCILWWKLADRAWNTADAVKWWLYKFDNTWPALSFTDNVSATYVKSDTVTVNWWDASVKKYTYTTSSTCPVTASSYTATSATSFNQTTTTNNWKYICLYAEDSLWNVSTLRSANTIHIDTTAPVCTWWTPTKTSIKVWQTWQIVLTCTDALAWIATTGLNASDITYTSTYVELSNAVVWWTSTWRTFTFTYTAKPSVDWQTTFKLPTNKVYDIAWNIAATKTSAVVIVDNAGPILSASNAWVWKNDDITITLRVSDTNGLNYAKYSRTSANDCLSNGTSFANWGTITYTTEWSWTLYLCAEDSLWNTATWSGIYYIDRNRPTITFNPSSWTPANTRSVNIITTDTLSKLASWIYINSDGSRTVVWSGINLTIAWEDLPWSYEFDVAWWWGNDWAWNGYDSWNPREERQWPCASGWHVPSLGERTSLIEAWCNLTEDCNLSYDYNWFPNIRSERSFVDDFNFPWGYRYRPSSIGYYVWVMWLNSVLIQTQNGAANYNVRCFKNTSEEPQPLKYRWETDSTCSSNKSDYTSTSRDSYDVSSTTATTTVTTEWLADGSYYLCVLSWSAVDNAWNTNVTTKSSGVFAVDNTKPTCTISQSPTALTSWNVILTATVTETNPDKYSWIWWNSMVTTLTTFTTWSNWARNFYVQDKAWNTWSCSITISNIDSTAPSTWTISINSNATYTKSKTVTLTLSASDEGAWMWNMRFSCNNSTWSAWENYATSKSWTFDTSNGCTASDGTKTVYVQYQDALWNGTISANDSIILDTTKPTVAVSWNSNAIWRSADISIPLTATDTTSWISGSKYYWTTSTSTTFDECRANWISYTNGETIVDNVEWKRVLHLCAYDKAWNTWSKYGTYMLDKIKPTCTLVQDPTTQTNWNVTLTATVTEANKSWYSWTWWTSMVTTLTTFTTWSNWTRTFYVQDKAWNTWSCSITISNIDKGKPTWTLTTTSIVNSESQRLTWTCTDEVWVTSYYFGTKASPVAGDYKTANGTSFTTWMDITSSGTYYLYCKDAAGNVSPAESKTYYSYEVHNMLNAVDKAEWTYNTTNYPQTGSTSTYIAPSGTSITMTSVYTVPQYSAAGQYKWWTTANNGTPSTATSDTLNGNKTYYYWFNRTKHTLTLTKKTWIETLYYKVNGASSFASTWVSTTVSVKDGSTAYTYAEASNCYTCASTCKSSSSPQTYSTITTDQTYAPTATENTNNITYNMNGWTNNASNPATYKITQLPITLQAPSKVWYTFKWWTWANGTTAQTSVTIAGWTCGALTYNATWQANTYKITYDYNTTNYTLPLNGYIDTKYIIDWDRNFKLNSTINFPTLNKRYLLFGNYNAANNLNLELKDNKLRAYSNRDISLSTATLAANTDIMIEFNYTASNKSYTFTSVGANSNATAPGTNDKTGVTSTSLRIWTDSRVNSTFTPYTLKSASITDYYSYGGKLTKLPNSPTKPWYTFLGWYTDAVGGTQVTTSTDVPLWDATYYAHWIDDIKPTFTVSNTSVNESQNLTINISAIDNGEWLHDQAYSCNWGSTWSSTASCNMWIQNEPTTWSVVIQVRDNAGNITWMTVNYQWKNTAPINVNITNNGSTWECKPITYTASATDTWATMNYQWYAWANCTNAISNAISQTYTHTLNNKWTYSVYVKVSDSQWSGTCSVVNTATWTDVVLTAYNFTGHENVGNTWKTVNWKELSDANAWSCESITASLKTDASHWSCVVNGNNITYSPDDNYEWDDTCVITLTDQDTTKDITVTRKNIDTTGPEVDPEHGAPEYWFVNSGHAIHIPLDVIESKWINTWEFTASDIHVYVNGVEKQPTKTLTYDSEVWWIYKYTLTLSKLTWDWELKIFVPAWSFRDVAWNPNRAKEWISETTVDNTIPTCVATQSPTVPTNENVTLTVNYNVELNKIDEWYSWNGTTFSESKTTVVSGNGIYTWYVKDAAWNIWRCSITVNNIDKQVPQVNLTSSSTPKSNTQRLTWVCTDTVWITQYYIWNSSTPSYVTIPSTGSFVTWMDITSAWTYYLYCKDDAWNVISGSKTYDSYTVYNMLETITWTQWIYNMINYAVVSSGTYIAPRQTILTLSDIYTLPQYASVDLYKWYSTSNTTVSPNTSSSVMLNWATTYYAWFDRDRYTLDVIMNTWIDVIGYNVNGTDTYSMTQSTLTDIEIKAWSEIRAYAIPKVWYTYTETSESNPWIEISTWNMVFSPMATTNTNTQYAVYHYVKRVWSGTYALIKTETWFGMTDEILTLSWLTKENEFPCAHYDRWSLTWTEDWPWEIVIQTTIKWDGSTEIYLYYTRNNRRVILSGDAHIESLEIDGNESTEAIRECGGEVPIKAKPKPWYHFVRWDRERERVEEDDDDETIWW